VNLFDAHNHLQDAALAPYLPEIIQDCQALGIRGMVVNGTEESDWDRVAHLAAAHPWMLPSYGIHPWKVDERSPNWQTALEARLDEGGCVGEIGLDRWKTTKNFDAQLEVFRWQLALAADRNLPVTIHCLRAWGPMLEILRETRLPAGGFLLHAYGGPLEMVPEFVKLGGYFSFSASFLTPGRERKLEPFRAMPMERLLVETDAPSMPPPKPLDQHPLPAAKNGERMHHPANLAAAYHGLAALRHMPCGDLANQIAKNFARLLASFLR